MMPDFDKDKAREYSNIIADAFDGKVRDANDLKILACILEAWAKRLPFEYPASWITSPPSS